MLCLPKKTKKNKKQKNEVTIHTLPHLKCIRLVSVRSSLPCIHIGVRIDLIFKKEQKV